MINNMHKIVIFVVMAMRDVHFFVKIAQRLSRMQQDMEVQFISYYQAGNQHIRQAGFYCYDVYTYLDTVAVPGLSKATDYEKNYGITNLHRLILHEKVTSGFYDDNALEKKLMTNLATANTIMAEILSRHTAKDITVIQELGGFIGPISVFFASQSHGINHIFLEPSFFRGRLHFVCNSLLAVDCSLPIPDSLSASESEQVADYLEKLRRTRTPVIPDKDMHHFRDMGVDKILNWENLSKLWVKLRNKYIHHFRHEFDFIFRYSMRHLSMYINRRFNGFLYSAFDDATRNVQYVYFPFHVQLDYALTTRCPEFLNQIALVDYLCSTLPSGYYLYVKEHPASIGGFRYSELQHLLRRHSNLLLIHPSVNSFDLTDCAQLVVTINSKAGAEAIVLGKPVVILGDAFYTRSGLLRYVSSLRQLDEAIRSQLSDEAIVATPQTLLAFFQQVWRYTYIGELYNLDDKNIANFTNEINRYLTNQVELSDAAIKVAHI